MGSIKCLACARYSEDLGCISKRTVDTFIPGLGGMCDNGEDCADFVGRTGVSLYDALMSDEREKQILDLAMERLGISRDEETRQLFIETIKNADTGAIYGR